MVRRALMAVVAVLVLWQHGLSAQRPTFQSAIELVNLNVTVVGGNQQPIVGLKEEQFEVLEDGVPQRLSFFAPGDLPVDVLILLDTSASMSGSMALIQEAAMRFAHALRAADRAAVMGISNGLRVVQPLSEDIAALDRAIKSTKPAGNTPFYASLYTALKELTKIRTSHEPRRQAIVVLSDGVDTASAFGFEDLLESVRREAIPIYTIAPRASRAMMTLRESVLGLSTHQQDYEMRMLARETGGRAFFPVALQELTAVYSDIANELTHQYSLGYQSTNAGPERGFRRIALRVFAPGVTWRTRTGYLTGR